MIRRGTRALWQEGRRTDGYGVRDFLHGYIYGRWPYLYIGVATGERRPPRWLRPVVSGLTKLLVSSARQDPETRGRVWADRYHGKVMPTEAAEQLVTLDRPIELECTEQVIPYDTARDIVLKEPDHIVALDCPCRSERESPCLPLDVCLIVGEPFASFVADHHPTRSRRITQAEAVDVLRAERDRGHVHHAFFKDAMLGRFYAICNCCSCCCGAMQAWQNGTPMLASSGYEVDVEPAACVGCGACVATCPFGALAIVDGCVSADREACMGCGVCVSKCATNALRLKLAPDRGEPLQLVEEPLTVRA
jgi:ferredoxin